MGPEGSAALCCCRDLPGPVGAQHRQPWPHCSSCGGATGDNIEGEDAWHVSSVMRPYAELQARAAPAAALCQSANQPARTFLTTFST